MNIKAHNLIVTEIINHLNECFNEHELDNAECIVTLQSIVASALVSHSLEHEECCALTHAFFESVHERVHEIIDTQLNMKELH